MKETLYLTDQEAILNFDLTYPETEAALIKSPEFSMVLKQYILYLEGYDTAMYEWAMRGQDLDEAVRSIRDFARQLLVFDAEEILSPYMNKREMALSFTEGFYDYWKNHERYSITTNRRRSAELSAFVQQNSNHNNLCMSTFRHIEQALMGSVNKIYRQQPAGTNAALALYRNDDNPYITGKYDKLRKIMFISSVMLRTPMILHPKSNKREWPFQPIDENPIDSFTGTRDDYFCFPAKVGELLIFIYFHRDFMASGVANANLFELATEAETDRKPDGILLFGNPDGRDVCSFHYDKENDIWVGSVTYSEKISYFGYMKKTVLTLHNVAMMQRGWLPIHGAFVDITLWDGKKKGICLMGDSGAGKSETIEALKNLGDEKIKKIEVVFDDMGTFHIEDGKVVAQGSEIGAFVRLDDLDPGTPYRDMNRSIFFNPDQSNARVITPAAPYKVVVSNHEVDLFAYANNYGPETGLRRNTDIEQAKAVFIEGKRMAKGTTQETGISTTYFANPFGPQQQQERCKEIIDEIFAKLEETDVFVGEVFTHLGRDPEDRSSIIKGAEDLLRFIEEN